MRMEKFNSALDHIDYDLIDEFVREQEGIEKRRAVKKAIIRVAPIAACLVICVGVGAGVLGFNLANDNALTDSLQNSSIQMQMLFSKEGIFVFEYEGRLYQAYVAPTIDTEGIDIGLEGSVSIKNVGDHITSVTVTDEKGNEAVMEIYSSKNGIDDESVLLKLDGGYFKATSFRK